MELLIRALANKISSFFGQIQAAAQHLYCLLQSLEIACLRIVSTEPERLTTAPFLSFKNLIKKRNLFCRGFVFAQAFCLLLHI